MRHVGGFSQFDGDRVAVVVMAPWASSRRIQAALIPWNVKAPGGAVATRTGRSTCQINTCLLCTLTHVRAVG
jgi:hypothetical protein